MISPRILRAWVSDINLVWKLTRCYKTLARLGEHRTPATSGLLRVEIIRKSVTTPA